MMPEHLLAALRDIARNTVTVVVHPDDEARVVAQLVDVPLLRVVVSDAGLPGQMVVFDGGLLEPERSPFASS